MTPRDLCKYMQALLQSLAHIHEHDIIHRDIKPANFLYKPGTDRYCLVDFGLAQRNSDFSHDKIEAKNRRRKERDEKTRKVQQPTKRRVLPPVAV